MLSLQTWHFPDFIYPSELLPMGPKLQFPEWRSSLCCSLSSLLPGIWTLPHGHNIQGCKPSPHFPMAVFYCLIKNRWIQLCITPAWPIHIMPRSYPQNLSDAFMARMFKIYEERWGGKSEDSQMNWKGSWTSLTSSENWFNYPYREILTVTNGRVKHRGF